MDIRDDDTGNGGLDGDAGRLETDAQQWKAGLAEQRYWRLVEISSDAICLHEGGRIVYANPAAVRWIGAQSRADLVGHLITEFIHPDSMPAMLACMAALRHEGDTSQPSETVVLRLDGTTVKGEAVSVLTDWEGRPTYQGIFRDLTPQHDHEAALHYQAALVSHVSDAIIAITLTGIVTCWNRAAEAIYRRPAAQALGILATEAVGAPLDPTGIIARGGIVHTTHRATDGSAMNVRVAATAMDNGYVLLCTDQTAQRRAERRFQTVMDSLDVGVLVIDKDGRFESVNPAAERMLGIPAADLGNIDRPRGAAEVLIYDADGEPVAPDRFPAELTRRTGATFSSAFGVDRPDGQRVWLSGSSRLLNPDDPADSAVLISFTDITAFHVATERLTHEAAHDSLTGLPNRAHVIARVTEALESGSPNELAAVLFIDLDNLKMINDSLGHDAGDDVLRIAAQRLRLAVRSGDLVARLGGDEFVALLCGQIARPDLDQLADRLHATLSEPIVIDGMPRSIGGSIGIVVVDDNDGRTAAEILRDADTAMYAAKAKGRGTSHYFTDQLRDRSPRDHTTDKDRPDHARPSQLPRTLGSRSMIDQAIGIIRSRAGGSAEEAFERLLRISQADNVKLAASAQRLVEEAVHRANAHEP